MKSKLTTGIILLMVAVGIIGCYYDLNVENQTSQMLDIYVDNKYEGTAAGGNSLFIGSLPHGEHQLEALDGNGDVVSDDIIYLGEDMTWVIGKHVMWSIRIDYR